MNNSRRTLLTTAFLRVIASVAHAQSDPLPSWNDGPNKQVMATHTGMTTAEFTRAVFDWLITAKHPTRKRFYTELVFQPMLELLTDLRVNNFKTFIVSGGSVEFMRAFCRED